MNPIGAARIRALVSALAVLSWTVAVSVAVGRLDRTRAIERSEADARAAAARALDGVHALLAAFELQVQNATANPRLLAALDAGVDQETLRDLLLNEPWWEPFRLGVEAYGMIREGPAPDVDANLPAGIDVGGLAARARALRRPVSTVRAVEGRVLALAAAPVTTTGPGKLPVLIAAKLLDVGTMLGIAERAGIAAGVSDNRHLLVGAVAGGAARSGAGDLAELKRRAQMLAPSVVVFNGTREALAALPLEGELRLLAHVRLGATGGGLPGGRSWSAVATLVLGMVIALVVFLRLAKAE